MRKLALFISFMMLLGISSSYAMEVEATSAMKVDAKPMYMPQEDKEATMDMSDEEKEEYMVEKKEGRDEMKEEMKEERMEMKEEMHEMKQEARGEVKDNRMEAGENRKEFRAEHKEEYMAIKAQLSDDQKEELEAIKADYHDAKEELKQAMKSAESAEEKEVIRMEMEELNETQFESVSEVLGNDAAELIEKRKNVYEENKGLRNESREAKSKFRSERKEYVQQYKGAFVKRIGNRLDNISTENLEEALKKIISLMEKIKNDSRLSDEAKDMKIDAIDALREIVEERIEEIDESADVLEMIDELLE